MGANFEKEAFIARLLASSGIPMPPIVSIGRLGELHYAISLKAAGMPLDQLAPTEFAALVPELIRVLDAIHAVDVGATDGYGVIGDDGRGLFPTWRRYIEAIREEGPDWEFYGKWHRLFEASFLEREVFDLLYARMTRLLDHCPEERALVHGNFGFGNALARDGKITAVLDWIDAKYGDFLFDIARLDFWAVGASFAAVFRDHYDRMGVPVPAYTECVRCCQHYIGLDALRFFAKAQDEQAFRWARERLLSSLP